MRFQETRRPGKIGVTTLLTLAALSLVSLPAEAGTITCRISIRDYSIQARGSFEGTLLVKARVDGASADQPWTLCSLSEGKTLSKNGAELVAVQDSYAGTCQAILNMVTVAMATGKKLELEFLDNLFPTCDDVPIWGGTLNVPGEDDPDERLGPWDGLWRVRVTNLDSAF